MDIKLNRCIICSNLSTRWCRKLGVQIPPLPTILSGDFVAPPPGSMAAPLSLIDGVGMVVQQQHKFFNSFLV
jgi:hypothetical protein